MAGITGKDAILTDYAQQLEQAPKGRSLTQDAMRRLFANKAFDDGSVCGSACNPGGVYNFYYGIGKLTPAHTDAYQVLFDGPAAQTLTPQRVLSLFSSRQRREDGKEDPQDAQDKVVA